MLAALAFSPWAPGPVLHDDLAGVRDRSGREERGRERRRQEAERGHGLRGGATRSTFGNARKLCGLSWQVSNVFFAKDEYFMRLAIREAERALEHGDVPIGAVVVRDGEVIGAGRNERELREDPTAHAEVLALREAARALGSWRVLDSVLYVTLEPCAMCAGAIVLARVPRVVYGTIDPKAGAAGSCSTCSPSRA